MASTTTADAATYGGPGILIILPVLNEAENIGPLLDGIGRALADRPHTVCIIDDGSTDGTVEQVEAFRTAPGSRVHLIRREKTIRGSQRGSALYVGVRWGLQHTTHSVFVEMDGDLSHRPEELPGGIRLVAEGHSDIAIASKYMPGSQVINRPIGRRFVSWVCSMAVRTLISRHIRDYSNGYRFYTRAAAQLVAEHRIKYGSPIYLTEVLALWLRRGLQVVEFPSIYIGRNEGLSKLRYIDLAKAATTVFEISVRYHLTDFEKSAGFGDQREKAAALVDR